MLDLAPLSSQNAVTHLKKSTLFQASSKPNGRFSDFNLENLLVTFNVVDHSFLLKIHSAIKLSCFFFIEVILIYRMEENISK